MAPSFLFFSLSFTSKNFNKENKEEQFVIFDWDDDKDNEDKVDKSWLW